MLISLSNILLHAGQCPTPPSPSIPSSISVLSCLCGHHCFCSPLPKTKQINTALFCPVTLYSSWKHQHSNSFLKPHINKQRLVEVVCVDLKLNVSASEFSTLSLAFHSLQLITHQYTKCCYFVLLASIWNNSNYCSSIFEIRPKNRLVSLVPNP